MRRGDVLIADAVICFISLIVVPYMSLRHGMLGLAAIFIIAIARIALQKLFYDDQKALKIRTRRRMMMNIDPISFELYFVFLTFAALIASLEVSFISFMMMVIVSALIRISLEYYWFSDRPNRWYSLRFRMYNVRRNMSPSYSERLQKILVTEVDGMKSRDFERYIADLLDMNGFKKIQMVRGGDFGVDMTADLDKDRYVFQCRRSESRIGIKAVQEAFQGREHYKADIAVVVTNNYFTKPAYDAADRKTALWDRERLGNLIRRARDSLSDEQYNEEMKASESEIRMFAALFDQGKGDIRLTEKVMGTVFPTGNIRSDEDVGQFLKKVSEHIYDNGGISERRLERLHRALEKNRSITPFEADMACYHLCETHTITIKDTGEARSRLAKAFLESEGV
ncbi:MAG: restriction endonuclease [Methanomassiliicoccaceae archaeon]|nr:restriction endonuclease [Methanomassiliicoccaceae archaeon]